MVAKTMDSVKRDKDISAITFMYYIYLINLIKSDFVYDSPVRVNSLFYGYYKFPKAVFRRGSPQLSAPAVAASVREISFKKAAARMLQQE